MNQIGLGAPRFGMYIPQKDEKGERNIPDALKITVFGPIGVAAYAVSKVPVVKRNPRLQAALTVVAGVGGLLETAAIFVPPLRRLGGADFIARKLGVTDKFANK